MNNNLFAQNEEQAEIDSLLNQIQIEKNDTNIIYLYAKIFYSFNNFNPNESVKYEKQAIQLAEKMGWKEGLAIIKSEIGRIYWRLGQFEIALKNHFEVLEIYNELGNEIKIANIYTYIGQDYGDSGNYAEAKIYFNKALKIFEEKKDKENTATIYGLLSWLDGKLGNFAESTKNNLAALRIYDSIGNKYAAAICMGNMAGDYASLGNYSEALNYYLLSLKPLAEENDNMNLCSSYNAIGDIYLKLLKPDDALKYHKLAIKLCKTIGNNFSCGESFRGVGNVYYSQGDYIQALENFLASAEMYESVFNKQELAGVYNDLAICYTKQKNYDKAKEYLDKVFDLSKELNSRIVITDYYKGIELLDSAMGNWKNAYYNYKYYIFNRDSIFNQENTNKIMQAQMQYDSEKREAAEKAEQEKKDIRQRTIRNSIAAGLAGSLVFLVIVYRQRNKISKEKRRSDELLLNILPAETAEELKLTGTTKAKDYDEVTVLFTDFKNFTSMSEHLSAQELVNEINYCYIAFDNIITKYGIEKIKTIGDSYMCAAGLPAAKVTHAIDTINASLEIRDFIDDEKQKRIKEGLPYFEIRIGLHSGPVVAGIVGIKKFAYDIWGDTVNIASRMESSGEIGKVNISGSTYELVKDKFICTHRGKIQAKNKGEIDMYFVDRRPVA